jgi:23S rRNA pseudouridine1911/1915/1917 synthase
MEKPKIIFEDDELLVLDKPSGLVVTREGGGGRETVEDWLAKTRKESRGLRRGGIAHRLDKGTSGLLLVAKTTKALEALQVEFRERRVCKEYLALVDGQTVESGEIKMPIGRKRIGVWGKLGVTVSGKMAITKFRRERLYRKDGQLFSLLEVKIETGRTHQIRVHLSYLGWPIVGDRLYGKGGEKRIYLHARQLSLSHPTLMTNLKFESPPPSDWWHKIGEYEEV